jgi:hypothetical protein
METQHLMDNDVIHIHSTTIFRICLSPCILSFQNFSFTLRFGYNSFVHTRAAVSEIENLGRCEPRMIDRPCRELSTLEIIADAPH